MRFGLETWCRKWFLCQAPYWTISHLPVLQSYSCRTSIPAQDHSYLSPFSSLSFELLLISDQPVLSIFQTSWTAIPWLLRSCRFPNQRPKSARLFDPLIRSERLRFQSCHHGEKIWWHSWPDSEGLSSLSNYHRRLCCSRPMIPLWSLGGFLFPLPRERLCSEDLWSILAEKLAWAWA